MSYFSDPTIAFSPTVFIIFLYFSAPVVSVLPMADSPPNLLPIFPTVFTGATHGIIVRALPAKFEIAPSFAISKPVLIPPLVTPLAKPIAVLGIKAAVPAVIQLTGSNMTSNANPNGRETILGAPNFPSKFPNPSCSLMFAFMFSKNPGLEPFPSTDSAAPATAYNGRLKALKPFVISPSGGGGVSSPALSGPYHCSLSF